MSGRLALVLTMNYETMAEAILLEAVMTPGPKWYVPELDEVVTGGLFAGCGSAIRIRFNADHWVLVARLAGALEGDYNFRENFPEPGSTSLAGATYWDNQRAYAPCPYCSATDHSMVDCPCTPSETI